MLIIIIFLHLLFVGQAVQVIILSVLVLRIPRRQRFYRRRLPPDARVRVVRREDQTSLIQFNLVRGVVTLREAILGVPQLDDRARRPATLVHTAFDSTTHFEPEWGLAGAAGYSR